MENNMSRCISGIEKERFAPITARLGEIFKSTRLDQGLTQTELREKAGLTQASVSRIENGEHSANVNTLIAMAQALGIKLSEVFKEVEAQSRRELKN